MRLLIADEHSLIREGLARIVLDVDASATVVEVTSATELRQAFADDPPVDAALFDDALLSPAEIGRVRRALPELVLVALDRGEGPANAERLLAAGVNAVALRAAPAAVLGATLRVALAGAVYVQDGRAPLPAVRRTGRQPTVDAEPNLTARQREVLSLVARDLPNKAIASQLGIGVRTVKGHLSVILRAMRTDNRAEAARRARGWLAASH
jgi:DNA-binding NarL/FixJ family response regulator